MLNFLLTQCELEDRDKVRYLYDHFHDELMRMAKKKMRYNRRGNDYERDAEDVVQNVYYRFTKHIYLIDINWEESRMESYVKTTLNNAIIDFYKMYKKYPDPVELNEAVTAEMDEEEFLARLNTENRMEEVVCAIRKLQPIYSLTLTYRFLEKMEIPEIAELMEVPVKTVYTRMERGKRILLAILDEGK